MADPEKRPRRSKPVAHRSGVYLYAPTMHFKRWRVAYTDPITGQRCQPTAWHKVEAERLFDDAVAYVDAAGSARATTPDLKSPPTVRDLFEQHDRRLRLRDSSEGYRHNRRSIFDVWIAPVCGSMLVRDWLLDDEPCLEVIAAARAAGKAAATIANIGGLMRSMVTTAHRLRWGPQTANPMLDVPYTAKAAARDGALWVPPSARPTTTMVDELAACMAIATKRHAVDGVDEMVSVGGYGGLRFGEQTALTAESVDAGRRGVHVTQAWRHPKGSPPELHAPKNGRARFVLLPSSLFDVVAERARHAEPGPDGLALLWPGPNGPGRPWTETQLRRAFYRAVRMCDWPLEADGTPAIPYRNLRHHAAVWLHEVARFDWADVSETLGHHSVAFTQARYVRRRAGAEDRNRDDLGDL